MINKPLMNEKEIARTLRRIADQILEENKGVKELAIVGIRTCGVYLAERIAAIINASENSNLPVGILDVNLYRDDLAIRKSRPVIRATEINFPVDEKKLILVDDILYTGRTTRAAMDLIMDFGRPASIKLAVLVDRGFRELPIKADYVGREFFVKKDGNLKLFLSEARGSEACGEPDKLILL